MRNSISKMKILGFDKPQTLGQWIVFLAAIGIICSSPYGTRAFLRELKKYIAEQRSLKIEEINSRSLSQALYHLKKRKIIKYAVDGDKTTLVLSEKGKRRLLKYRWENMRLPIQEKWDGKWRMLMFDIPEDSKPLRELFRRKLKRLGFAQFQKSIWLYPYPCNNEVDFIAERYSVAEHINMISVIIDGDEPLRAKFNL